ncbi:AMIN-like domain-containing (lipo)protein [Streptomyces sp. INA 01156]
MTLALVGGTLGTAAAPAAATPTASPDRLRPGRDAPVRGVPHRLGQPGQTAPTAMTTPVRDVRTGHHTCYDRMVVDLPGAGGSGTGYTVRYVDRLYQDGSGRPVPSPAAPSWKCGWPLRRTTRDRPAHLPRARRTASAGSGPDRVPHLQGRAVRSRLRGRHPDRARVRTRLPFRVLQLPDRLVIDVAHSWTDAS